jgi:hypothetical protein
MSVMLLSLATPSWAQDEPALDDGTTISDGEVVDVRSDLDSLRSDLQAMKETLRAERDEIRALREQLQAEATALQSLNEVREAQREVAAVAEDVIGMGQRIVIRADQSVGNVVSNGQDVVVRGHVAGDVSAVWGDVIVDESGVIEGDAVAVGGEVRVRDGGQILGNQVQLPLIDGITTVAATDTASLLSTLYHRIVFLLAFAGAGVLAVGLFPNRIGRIADAISRRPVRAGLSGTLWSLGLGATSLAFLLTLIGIPITLLLVAVLGLAWMLGFVGLCQALGDRLPFAYKPHGRWLAFLIGSFTVSFIGALPWIGWFVVLAASVLGVGAAFATRFGGRSLA